MCKMSRKVLKVLRGLHVTTHLSWPLNNFMKSRFVHFVNLFVGSFLTQKNRTETKKTKSVNYGRVWGRFEATNPGLFGFFPEGSIGAKQPKSLACEREQLVVQDSCRLAGEWELRREDETKQRWPSSPRCLLAGIFF